MTARRYTRSMALAGIIVIAALTIYGVVDLIVPPSPPTPLREATEMSQGPRPESPPPSLDCAFHDMMRTRAIVSFYFDVDLSNGSAPRFYERAIVTADGKRTNFEGDHRPAWTYALDGDGKPTITSPDGAARIVLYGLKLGAPGVLPVEAGIRSNEYRNLGGECRQTNLLRASN